MKASRLIARGLTLVATAGSLLPHSAAACSVCFAEPGSPMQQGMNMGILSMLVVTGLVLGAFVGFIVYLARRARHLQDAPESQTESLDLQWLDGKEKVR